VRRFTFTSDVDPLSITGYNSAGNAGAISGLELAGTTVTVNFADGTQESQTFGDGSQGGSDALVPTGIPATVSLEVQGVTLGGTGFSNGARGAFVTDTAQTAVVSGPAGTNVTLIVVNANMEDEPAGGFRDVDPFEQNKAQTVTYLNAVVGAGGSVNIPFTVTSNAGWSTYLIAAADDTAGSTVGISGIPTTPVYLEIGGRTFGGWFGVLLDQCELGYRREHVQRRFVRDHEHGFGEHHVAVRWISTRRSSRMCISIRRAWPVIRPLGASSRVRVPRRWVLSRRRIRV
jgi:hypothetical protein